MSVVDLELKRRKIKAKLINFRLILAFLTLFFCIFIFHFTNDLVFAIIGGAGGYFFIYEKLYKRTIKDIADEFKYEVVAKLIGEISPNLTYQKNTFISEAEFSHLKIYEDYDYFKGNDLISGEFENVNLRFSDLCVERVQYTSKYRKVVKVFYGIMFIAKFNKKFYTRTIILDKSSNAKFRLQKTIKLDNSDFCESFNTYSDNITQCFYLITPKLMQQILRLKKRFKCPINFIFDNGDLIIFIERNFDSFEIDINQTLVGTNSYVSHTKSDILRILNIVKELNLNDKIFKL